MKQTISIIFPYFNESKRLHFAFKDIKVFNKIKFFKKIEYIFINDGSYDNSFIKIEKFIKEDKKIKNINFKNINLKKNFGKGYAIKKGIEQSKHEWILSIDIDISVSLKTLVEWFSKNYININTKKIIYFGSRNLNYSRVKFKIHRKILGHIFNYFTKLLIKTNISDTQCGFKLYKKEIAKRLFKKMVISGFSHDIEIISLCKLLKLKIKELPVKWVHRNDSKLNIFFDPIKMLIEIMLLKIRYF